MDTVSFILYIKTDDIYKNMLQLDLIHQIMHQIDHYLKEKIKKVIGLMKEKLGGKIMTEFVGLRAKSYGDLMDDCSEDKKQNTQKSVS